MTVAFWDRGGGGTGDGGYKRLQEAAQSDKSTSKRITMIGTPS